MATFNHGYDPYGISSPCLNCKKRTLKCHGNCEPYDIYRSKLQERTKMRKDYINRIQYGSIDSIERIKKYRGN